MRRTGGLWEKVVAFESLSGAAYRVLRGKRGRSSAGDFFGRLEDELLRLQRELEDGSYRPGGYRTFRILEPKPRLISAASFRDRVVHHALVAAIEPVFERRFIADSYACRAGKGTTRALEKFVGWARASRYVLTMDVHRFFPSIDHEILKQRLRRPLKDDRVLELCDRVIDGSNPQDPVRLYFPGDDLFTPDARRHGLPIGNLTSQFLANVYLDELDHFVKERNRAGRYLRYVDDFCCFGEDKAELADVRAAIVECLAGLRLRLNEGKSRVRRVGEGIEFLGFVVRPASLRLSSTAVRRNRRRLRKLQRAFARGEVTIADVGASVRSWTAHAAHGSTRSLREAVGRGSVFRADDSALGRSMLKAERGTVFLATQAGK